MTGLIDRISEYLREYHETYPGHPMPTPDEVHEALDCAAEPTLRSDVRERMAGMDDATVICGLTLLALDSADPTWAIWCLEKRGVEGAAAIVEKGRAERVPSLTRKDFEAIEERASGRLSGAWSDFEGALTQGIGFEVRRFFERKDEETAVTR